VLPKQSYTTLNTQTCEQAYGERRREDDTLSIASGLHHGISGLSYAQPKIRQIPVLNPGFEDFVLNGTPSTIEGGGCWNAENPGWQSQWFNLGSGGTFRPVLTSFQKASRVA